MKRLLQLLLLIALVGVYLYFTEADTPTSGTLDETVLNVRRVVDGDTFVLSDGRRVRLIGIDTPEKHASDKLYRDAERTGHDARTLQRLGRQASDHAEALVSGRTIRLDYDAANTATAHKDRHGRTLAYVHVLDDTGAPAFMVNFRMVEDGYAYAYTRFPMAYPDDFRRLEREARDAQRGLWADDAF